MKFIYTALLLIVSLDGLFALPATIATIPTPGYHTFFDPKTGNCGCVPDDKREKECLEETICVEFDIPMRPVWDDKTEICSCKPRSDAEFICIAATTCLEGSSPHWNPSTQECSCLKNTDFPSSAIPSNVRRSNSSPTKDLTQRPAPTVDKCTQLKIFCECGDHYMHWDDEKKACQCPPCAPVVSFGCENLLIYCNDGDHRMHFNPDSKKCECPPSTAAVSSPVKRQVVEVSLPIRPALAPALAPTTTPRDDHCLSLRIFCPCGDHNSHYLLSNESKYIVDILPHEGSP
ncbi:uncharacterized protein RAG0_06298 [Rhynchosporium agropyri]|uniref:Uncharacterized protein n=1 Tax=Rhynchosporium agropyri TaxID=914238 RepID=A0A1E1KGH6_9HELO|nr:uncharacterized protein RAG0_06298 [Rhynchosporium agropyri]